MKLILNLLLLAIVLVFVAVFGALFYVDSIARKAVEEGGSYALGVATQVQKVHVGVIAGQVSLENLTVANPPGFDGPRFLKLGSGSVEVSLATLTKTRVVLPQLLLEAVELSLEKKGGAQANYEVILANLKRLESSDKPAASTGEGKKFIVQEVIIRDINVDTNLLPLGGKATAIELDLPEIRFTYDSEEGLPMSYLSSLILKAVLKAVVDKAGGLLPREIIGGLDQGLAVLGDVNKLKLEVVGNVTKQVQQIQTQVEQATGQVDKIGKEVDQILDGLGGLLKKKDGAAQD
jgi:uncharacterized protein involved in outer membrane biogenesis